MPDGLDITQSSTPGGYGVDLPVTMYDRPTLMMSNLLLRGDVDAATRALFTPESLTPAEMQTFRTKFLGKNPNPILKTIADVATNPLVILGLVGGFLLYPAAKPDALLKLYQGLRQAPPVGRMSAWAHSAFARLRNYPGLYDELATYGRDAGNFVHKWGKEFTEAFGAVPGIGKNGAAGQVMAGKLQGWEKPGSRLQKVWWGKKAAKKEASILQGTQGVLSPAQISGADKSRNILKRIGIDDLKKDPAAYAKMKEAAKEQGMELGDMIDDYFPRHVRPNEVQAQLSTQLRAVAGEDKRKFGPMSKNLFRFGGRTIPDPAQLRALEGAGVRPGFTNELLKKVDDYVGAFRTKLDGVTVVALQQPDQHAALKTGIKNLLGKGKGAERLADTAATQIYAAAQREGGNVPEAVSRMAKMIKYPGTYSLDFAPAIDRYVSGMAPTWSWHLKGNGKIITGSLDKFRKLGHNMGQLTDYDEKYITDQLLPYMSGQRTTAQMSRSVANNEWRLRRATWLKTNPTVQKRVPEKSRKWLIDKLEDFSMADSEAIGHGINHYLYLSTMGANLGPPSKNIFQNILTFANMPGMGLRGLAVGAKEVYYRGRAYLHDVAKIAAKGGDDVAKGLAKQAAFKDRFPEFLEMLGPQADMVKRMFGGMAPGAPGLATAAKGTIQKAEELAMLPFKASEITNRLVAFYGARGRALSWGATSKEALKVGANVVDIAHFTGGPMGMPSGIMDLWPPLRQFMQFPMRFGGFLADSVRWGKDAAKMDFGTIGRTLAASAATYTVGRNILGMDLSQGLAVGALPVPQYEHSAFYPFPLVPPAVQMVGNVAKGVLTGEARPIQDTAALLVPGGLAAKRLHKTLGSKRADYENRLPDGRVPVYNDDGGLIGAYTPLQLGLRSLGLMPTDVAAERGAAQWLVSQRDQIRQYRRSWLDAMMANDTSQMESVQSEFQKRYPELGPLRAKKSDIYAIEQRREVARVHRILRGFPRAYKPLFGNIVQEAELGAFTQTLPSIDLPPTLQALQ